MNPVACHAIETSYQGYRFRSRIEARWAVFFDHFRLNWSYEPQGYKLPSGMYLPDFELNVPQWGIDFPLWVEIKATRPRLHELALALELSEATDRGVLVIHGQIPADNSGEGMYLFMPPDHVQSRCRWRCTRDRGLFVQSDEFSAEPMPLDPAVRTGYQRARSARFEYGESGAGELASSRAGSARRTLPTTA